MACALQIFTRSGSSSRLGMFIGAARCLAEDSTPAQGTKVPAVPSSETSRFEGRERLGVPTQCGLCPLLAYEPFQLVDRMDLSRLVFPRSWFAAVAETRAASPTTVPSRSLLHGYVNMCVLGGRRDGRQFAPHRDHDRRGFSRRPATGQARGSSPMPCFSVQPGSGPQAAGAIAGRMLRGIASRGGRVHAVGPSRSTTYNL